MNGIRNFLNICMIMSIIGCVHAQNTRQLSLDEAIKLGVENSKQLRQAEASLDEAKARVAQARDRAWPEVKVSATYLRINTPKVSFKNSSDDSNSGGSSDGGNSLGAAFSNLHEIQLGQVSLTQPIFSGFKIRNTRLMETYLAEAARYDVNTSKSKVVVNTARAFFNYYELLETQKLVEQNLRQAQQRVTEFKNLEAQSLLARNDRLKAELQANNIELTRTEVNNNVALAQFNLNILLGLPDSTVLMIDTTEMFKNPPIATWDIYLQKGLENRSELKSAQWQVKAGEASERIAKANRYPSLALTAGYVNANLPGVLSVTNALNAGLSLQWNITGAIHSKHVINEARAREQKTKLSEQISNDQVRSQIKEKFLNYQKSLEKIRLSEQAIVQAEENFKITKNKYEAGLVILSDYLDADVTLLQTRIDMATARSERMIAYYELEESVGNIQ
jgi:outer membrane protein TolC